MSSLFSVARTTPSAVVVVAAKNTSSSFSKIRDGGAQKQIRIGKRATATRVGVVAMTTRSGRTNSVFVRASSSDDTQANLAAIEAKFRAERAASSSSSSDATASSSSSSSSSAKVEHDDKTAFYAMAMKRHAEKLLANERAKAANYPMFRTTDVDKNFAEFSAKCDGLMRLFGATGTLFVLDKVISKKVAAQGISFPGPLVVMFGLIFALLAMDALAKDEESSLSTQVCHLFAPAMDWITSWLPVFYVPSLVTLPLVVSTMEAATLGKIVGLLVAGFVVTCAFSAKLATTVRQMTGVEMQPLPQEKAKPPTTDLVKQLVGFTTLMSYLSASWLPATDAYQPFFVTVGLVGATVSSLLIGNVDKVKSKMNPIVTCAVLSNLGVYIMGLCTGAGYQATLKLYKSGVSFTDMSSLSAMGAGDILMAFLGSVIVSFAFKVYGARKIIKRHAVEIFTCLVGTSTFAMFSTAFLGRLIGLTPAISLALVPRSVTVALAMPVTVSLGHPEMVSLTAAAVVLTGLLGSALATKVLDQSGANDPVSRGMATAASSHGLGTAALVSKEPEALPYAALSYALSGIVSSVLAATPVITAALVGIAGGAGGA
jgi:putative effector of murein hydrolase